MSKIYIGVDNGTSGSVGWASDDAPPGFVKTPVFNSLNYQKDAKKLNRVDVVQLSIILRGIRAEQTIVLIERPMVNPGRFQATASALRALEATLIVLERLKLPYQFIDSKQWQKEILPKGIKGSAELKKASVDIANRMFPQLGPFKGDADGLLIAEWSRRRKL